MNVFFRRTAFRLTAGFLVGENPLIQDGFVIYMVLMGHSVQAMYKPLHFTKDVCFSDDTKYIAVRMYERSGGKPNPIPDGVPLLSCPIFRSLSCGK